MKTITYLLLMLFTAVGFAQNAPIDFEAGGNGASWTWTVFENNTNPPLNVIANPDPTGVNTTATVAEFTALQAGNPWAGVESLHGADIGTFTLDATNALLKIWVWKPVVSNVGIKFSTASGASTGEILVANTLTNQWEELIFDFSSKIGEPTSTDIDQIVVFPDFDARAMDNVIYFDNITFEALPAPMNLPFDFEGIAPAFADFNGSFTQVIANPDVTGVNTSANVAENTIPGGVAFAGVNIPVAIDITIDKFFRMDVWSPLAGTPVLLKLEGGGNPPIERQATLTTTGAWEEIVFDFSTEGALTYTSVTLFMNFNVIDPATQIYYWDNLEQYGPVAGLPFTFEGTLPTFGDFNGSFTQVIANPDVSGVNMSANVAENTIPGGVAFAGVNIPVTYDIITNKYFNMDVWSPLAGTPVLLKLEGGPNPPIERQAVLTTTGAWETIEFDFSAEGALAYESVTIFMNFNVIDGASQTYYWDNLIQTSGPSAPFVPIDFEVGGNGATWTWTVFENASNPPLNIIANPDPTGANTSATVAEFTALQAGNPWAGVESLHGADIGTFTLDASNAIVKIMVWKPVISNVGIKFATLSGASTGEILVPNTLVNQWEELTFDFSGIIGAPSSTDIDQIVVFPDFDSRTMDNVVYFDNISFSSSVPVVTMLPLDFEGVAPVFGDFNGSLTQVIANPDATGVNTSANVAENTIPGGAAFAGVNIPVTYDIITDKYFRMDVWSPLAGTPVLLKLEGGPNPPIERQAVLTTTGAWEEILFDFSSEGPLAYESVTVFMNFNVVDGADQTYYWDNLEQFTPVASLPFTFEGFLPTFGDFNGSATQVIANPDATGVNASANVAENTIPGGAAFAGVNIPVTYDIITDKYFRMDVWSPLAGMPVLLKLEGGPNPPIERQAVLTTNGAWEEVVFDFSSEGPLAYESVTIFMNFNMVDGANQTYYWDNLEQFTLLTDDTCAGATPMACGDVVTGDTTTNTDTGGFNGAPDVWYSYTGTGAQEFVTFSLCDGGTSYDSRLTVYDMCGAVELATNDDFCGLQSQLGFLSDGTTTYYVAIEGFSAGNAGPYSLELSCSAVAANDECANAEVINCGDVVVGSTNFATFDTAAPDCGVGITAPGVWYTFSDATGFLTDYSVDLCDGGTAYDSKLTVYVGDDCGTLTCIGDNDDDCGLQSSVSWQSGDVATYYVLVHGFGGGTGDFSLTLSCEGVPPPNDMIANSIDVDEIGYPYTDPNVAMPFATTEAGSPVDCDNAGALGVWYNFVPAGNGSATASITTPAGPSSVTFYTAPNESAVETDLVHVDYFLNQCVDSTEATILTTAGQAYYVYVYNHGGATDIVIDGIGLGTDNNSPIEVGSYPNPMDTVWNVEATDEITQITIYNIIGQQVISAKPLVSNYAVDVSQLESGMYLAEVATLKGSQTIKLIKK